MTATRHPPSQAIERAVHLLQQVAGPGETHYNLETARFCRHHEAAYQEMVLVWRAGGAPHPFAVPANGLRP